MEWMFDRGYSWTVAERLVPALVWGQPRLHAGGARMFPLTQHAVAGWRRLAPARSRPPVPWRALAAAVVTLAEAGRVQSALMLLLMFETYMRPAETLSLTPMQIIDRDTSQSGTARYVAVLIRAEELGQPSKTNEFDHAMALDLDRQIALGSRLAKHAEGRPPTAPCGTWGNARRSRTTRGPSRRSAPPAWARRFITSGTAALHTTEACALKHCAKFNNEKPGGLSGASRATTNTGDSVWSGCGFPPRRA